MAEENNQSATALPNSGQEEQAATGGEIAPTISISSTPQSGAVGLGSAAGGSEYALGAAITPRYHHRAQDIVGVDVNDLREFKSASIEEFLQFVVGEFFAAGAFWLGIERIATITEWHKDAVFWICVIGFIAGLIIGFFGYRQLARRQTRIENIIATAMRGPRESAGT